jgi:hypothetical protein
MKPEIAPEHLEILLAALPEDGHFLEIGSGWSTVWLAERLGAEQLLSSVEHDRGWWERILPMVVRNEKVDYLLREGEFPIGPYATTHRENPAGLSGYIHAVPYDEADVIFIDGIARGCCFVAALFTAEPGTKIFFHDCEEQRRPWYEWAWELNEGSTLKRHARGTGHAAEMLEWTV